MPAQPHTVGVTDQLAEHVAAISLDQLPDEVVDRTKRVIVDSAGCMLLGATLPPGEVVARDIASLGGTEQATVVGQARRFPAALAALANGAAAHADELDGVHRVSAHPAAISLAACLATGEAVRASGTQLLEAITATFDLGCGLLEGFGGGLMMKRAPNHLHSSPFMAIGAGAGCARLHDLSAQGIASAMALAAMHTFVPEGLLLEPTHQTKAYAQGQAAFAGVTGARLAAHGLATHAAAVEAPDGLAAAWWHDEADLAAALRSVRGEHHVLGNGFKYYSAGYAIQAPIALTLGLLADHGLGPQELAEVRVGMTTSSADKVDGSVIQGVSLQDMLSIAIARGRLGYEEAHDPANATDELVAALRERITVLRDPELDAIDRRSRAAWVEVRTSNGSSYRTGTELPAGHGTRGGMPWDDVRAKFHTLAEGRLHPAAARALVEQVTVLEDVADVGSLGELLAAAP